MSYWVNGCVLANPSDRMGIPLAILAIMFLNCPVLLTWQTMGLFRRARRRGGFWSTVAVLTCVAMWLPMGESLGQEPLPTGRLRSVGVPDRDLRDRIPATISPERRGVSARGGTESGVSRQAARFV